MSTYIVYPQGRPVVIEREVALNTDLSLAAKAVLLYYTAFDEGHVFEGDDLAKIGHLQTQEELDAVLDELRAGGYIPEA